MFSIPRSIGTSAQVPCLFYTRKKDGCRKGAPGSCGSQLVPPFFHLVDSQNDLYMGSHFLEFVTTRNEYPEANSLWMGFHGTHLLPTYKLYLHLLWGYGAQLANHMRSYELNKRGLPEETTAPIASWLRFKVNSRTLDPGICNESFFWHRTREFLVTSSTRQPSWTVLAEI